MAVDSRPSGDSGRAWDDLGSQRGGLMVCGTTSDAGKSLVVAGLCRLLARNGVRVAPFKAQNMANNAAVTADGAEIGHAQWIQAVAAGVPPTSAMNPVLLKPTGERTSQVVVRGRPVGEMTAQAYQQAKLDLRPVVLDALDELRSQYDVVICEGAGSPTEINLLERDLVNLGLAEAAGLPAVVVGDIDRGGVFAALYGTVALLPDHLRSRVQGFVVNRLRGDPALLGTAFAELEQRCGVPTLGVLPYLPGMDIDAEDSLALDHPVVPAPGASSSFAAPRPNARRDHRAASPTPDSPLDGDGPNDGSIDRELSDGGHLTDGDVLDVVAVRWPFVANAGDLDPLRLEPGVAVRWVRSLAELGRPDLVVLPGSKATRADLGWFRASGLADAVARLQIPVVAICAGLQMLGQSIDDPLGVEGPPGQVDGLGWLPVTTTFQGDKVLDRPSGRAVAGAGAGQTVAGYRIHHGRVEVIAEHDHTRSGSAEQRILGSALPEQGPSGAAATARGAGPLAPPTAEPAAGTQRLEPWLVDDDGAPLGWHDGRLVCGTTLHAVFEDDGFRADLLRWVAERAGKQWAPGGVSFAAARMARLDRIADAIEDHLDLDRLGALIRAGDPARRATTPTKEPVQW